MYVDYKGGRKKSEYDLKVKNGVINYAEATEEKKLKKQRFTSNLHQLMQKSVQARKNCIISRMNGQS